MRRAICLLFVAFGLSACTSSPAPTPSPPPSVPAKHELGISDNLAHLPSDVLAAQLATMRDIGITWVRKDMEWRSAEPVQGSYNWTVNDSTVAAISKAGFKPLLILDYAPQWAAGNEQADCTKNRCSPADTTAVLAAFESFVENAVKHYCAAPYNVQAFEIWNEPNLSKYWPHPDPTLYTKFLRAARDGLKNTGCPAKIILGGLGDAPCAGCLSSSDFLKGVYGAGGKGLFDIVGSHPYIANVPTPQTWQPLTLHAIMAQNGDDDKQVWATEFAYSSRFLSPETQANYMQQAIQIFRDYPWSGPLFWFGLQDTPNDSQLGVIDVSGNPKPALSKLKELTHNG